MPHGSSISQSTKKIGAIRCGQLAFYFLPLGEGLIGIIAQQAQQGKQGNFAIAASGDFVFLRIQITQWIFGGAVQVGVIQGFVARQVAIDVYGYTGLSFLQSHSNACPDIFPGNLAIGNQATKNRRAAIGHAG